MVIDRPKLLPTKRVLFLARHVLLRVYELKGMCEGLPLTMLVADDGSTLPYIRHLAFSKDSTIEKKGVISALNAHHLADSRADIVVVGANQLLRDRYARRGFHIVPKWICAVVPIPEGPDGVIAKIGHDARKSIRKSIQSSLEKGYTYQTTTDPSWFDMFYNDVYLRYGRSRYGELAQLDDYSRARWAFDRGVGLIVTLRNDPVMAGIMFREESTMRLRYMGIFPDKEEAAFEGVPTLLYYSAMKLAHEWGCTAVNLGSSRPFLSDGVLRFKMKWQPEPVHDELATAFFAIAAPGMSEPARSFLAANPFFEMVGEEFRLHRP